MAKSTVLRFCISHSQASHVTDLSLLANRGLQINPTWAVNVSNRNCKQQSNSYLLLNAYFVLVALDVYYLI